MPRKKATAQDLMRLDAIAEHLKIESRYQDPSFKADVTAACLARIAPVVDELLPCSGEKIALGLSEHLNLTFEEIHGPDDVTDLEHRYLKGKKELGFAQLRDEIDREGVDALLFQRMHAKEHSPDRWVAVLNLQESRAKAYWNRFHELSHRIAEPPQQILPFRRHQFEASNPVESLIDSVAAEFAFYEPTFRPLVQKYAKRNKLCFDVVDKIRRHYAPTASLLATMNAVVKFWPQPAAALTAELSGRRGAPGTDRALRIKPQVTNAHAAGVGLSFFPNMRAPKSSPLYATFSTGLEHEGEEHLGDWGTSSGKFLEPVDVYTSARKYGDRAYSLFSV